MTAVSGPASSGHEWAIVGIALALGLCLFGLIFHTEVETAIYVWINSDAYSHCFLILPIAGYLAWDRRDRVRAITPQPAPSIALLAMPAAAAWFVVDRLGIMEGRQFMAMVLLEIMIASVLGPRIWRALAVPLLYLLFLVPFGEFLVPPLQHLAVHFTTIGLNLIGIPNFSSGVTVEIPEGTFLIHQACSGLRFLIASAAFAVLYACIMYTSFPRRILFTILFLAVSVIGNDFRVLGTILLAHFTGNVQAVEADHVLWGWLFYVIIGLVIVLIGLPFRQDRPVLVRVRVPVKGRTVAASIIALMLVVLPAAASRLSTNYLNRSETATASSAQIEIPTLPGCLPASPPASTLAQLVPPGLLVGASTTTAYNCGAELIIVTLHRYPPRIGVRELFLSLRGAETPPGWDIVRQMDEVRSGSEPSAPTWRVTEATSDKGRHVVTATAMWIDGRPTAAGIGARVSQALNSMRPSARAPVLAVVTSLNRGAIDSFLVKTSRLSAVVDKWITESESANGR